MTFAELRWGLQFIAEEGLGRLLLQQREDEDEAYRRAQLALGAH